jgi:transcriptional regulator GlxA family with amidase domain
MPIRFRSRHASTRYAFAIDFMTANVDQDISVDDLASVACVSPFHFHPDVSEGGRQNPVALPERVAA